MAVSKVVVDGEALLDLTKDTVQADKLAAGYTAHDKAGNQITGTNTFDVDSSEATATAAEVLAGKTFAAGGEVKMGEMPNNGAIQQTISDVNDVITIPVGFHDGSGTVQISETEKAKFIPDNIPEGMTLLGVPGRFTGAGEIVTQSKEVTPSFEEQVVLPDEGYNGLSQVTVGAIPVTRTENAAGGITVTIGA